MRLRKIISSAIIFPVLFLFAFGSSAYALSFDTLEYLKKQDRSDAWVLMALRSAGYGASASSLALPGARAATDIERTILGVTAANEDPTSFKGKNLIQQLDALRASNQIGNGALINDDIWGILAYRSAGISNSDARIQGSKNFILDHQNSDGGWSHATIAADSDSNDTAIAIVALIEAGVSRYDNRITNAVNYLKTTQNSDAGFAISPGQTSDSASTAWVISALQKAGIPPASLTKGTQTPFTFLNTLKVSDGSYKWKTSDGKGNAVMASYVTIALEGKSYPVNIISGTLNNNTSNTSNVNQNTNTVANNTTTANPNHVLYRIEGSQNQICQGSVQASTALDLIQKAAQICQFSYQIENTSFGQYVKRIGSDTAVGTSGWLYLVNWRQPSTSASDYRLHAGDYVTWYFGEFDWNPLRLTILNRSQAQQNGNVTVLVEEYINQNSWRKVSGANVFAGGSLLTTNSQGQASIQLNRGTYDLYAMQNSHVRSAKERLIVNGSASTTTNSSNLSRNVQLQTTIIQNFVQSNTTQTTFTQSTPSNPQLSFQVDVTNGYVEFGNLKPGQSATRSVTLRNTGNRLLRFTSSVSGDSIFTGGVRLNNQRWDQFSQSIQPQNSANVNVSIVIPSTYNDSGTKSGELIFWANQ